MKIIVCDSYEAMSRSAADIFSAQIKEKPTSVLGLATGSTPIGMYDCLVSDYENGEVDFSGVVSFNLDEYYPISPDNEQSYRYFMDKHLFSRVNIDIKNTSVPNGLAKNAAAECEEYDARIAAAGGIDLQVLGIGQNGHIGFNEPSSSLISGTHVTALAESTVKANARFFESEADVPKSALTMGVRTILSAKRIVLLANGYGKHRAVKALLDDGVTTDVPATLLKLHSDVTLICDKEAYYGSSNSGITVGIDLGGTEIKAGVVDGSGRLLARASARTRIGDYRVVAADMAELAKRVAGEAGYTADDICAVGIGCPGVIDTENGRVVSASNLGFTNVPLADEFRKHLNVPVLLENDANAAAYGEYRASGEGSDSFVLITLGTGVGSGIIINGRIYRGRGGYGGELGHILLRRGGKRCACGRRGCFEQYASATALIAMTKRAIAKNPDSLMAKGEVCGKTAFDAARAGDAAAKQVVSEYISSVAEGIIDLTMLLCPDKIVIGGGISGEGEPFAREVAKEVGKRVFEAGAGKTEISAALLRNDAGIIGAALAAADL